MINLFQVSKAYTPGEEVLDGLSLDIQKGEFICLTGKSGAGKTTLLRMIFCEDFPDSGQVIIDGRNISRINRRDIARLRRSIGVVFQDYKLIDEYTVYENIALRLRILGEKKDSIKEKVEEILSMVGLEHRSHHLPTALSGGEQQRVAIARALVNHPKILLADEPTGNLDEQKSKDIIELLKFINLRGTTILMVTHNHALIDMIHKRHIHLHNGRVGLP
ncbi:MAG TPA: cell division ATP-binding protein FtsE [Oligoflexia bacterium]|nr:cell division ATP-binding protein FtsE [Oligoflexia bacterium]HMR24589.1 cell division ATP-binding protein FtsE [Oligoflexia bacterium]